MTLPSPRLSQAAASSTGTLVPIDVSTSDGAIKSHDGDDPKAQVRRGPPRAAETGEARALPRIPCLCRRAGRGAGWVRCGGVPGAWL